jgi:uncharacterized protein
MIAFVQDWILAVWAMMLDSAFWLLVGILAAGLIHLLLHRENIVRLVGGRSYGAVIRASLLGVPLPLCSCAVLPVAYQLRRSGVSRGATSAFLISTPESGVDSILLTYSLTDPLLTIARPVTAMVTASVAGFWETSASGPDEAAVADDGSRPLEQICGCEDGCGCEAPTEERGKVRQVAGAIDALLRDMAPLLVLGYALAGLVAVLLPPDSAAIPEFLRQGWGGYLGALVIGLPMYICATSSTPLAAALLAAGFTPGAILVFLMVGPATNVASLVVLRRILSGWGMWRYLATILVMSVLAGLVVDYLYGALGVSVEYLSAAADGSTDWFPAACAVILAVVIVGYTFVRYAHKRV